MLAKLIVWGEDRPAACAAMLAALAQCEVVGVATNIAFLERVVAHGAFAGAQLDTGLIEKHREALFPPSSAPPERALLAMAAAEYVGIALHAQSAAAASEDPYSPWHARDAWWVNTDTHALTLRFIDGDVRQEVAVRPLTEHRLRVTLPTRTVDIDVDEYDERLHIVADGATFAATVIADGEDRYVFAPGARRRLALFDPLAHAADDGAAAGHLTAPMSGAIVAVMVKAGDQVARGAPLIVLEAMKMEHTIVAPAAGVVAGVHFRVGDRVAEGAALVDLEDA
jgi:3-methylcrotonyl-CoA carboxylase alpha subunit